MKTHVSTTAWLTDSAEFRVRTLDGGGHVVWISDTSDADNKVSLMFTQVGAVEPLANMARLRDALDGYLIAVTAEPEPSPPLAEPEPGWTIGRTTSQPPPAEPASPADGHGEQE